MFLYPIFILLSINSATYCSLELGDIKESVEKCNNAQSRVKGFSLQCTRNSAGEAVHISKYSLKPDVWVNKNITFGIAKKPIITLEFGSSNTDKISCQLLGTLIVVEEQTKWNAIAQQNPAVLTSLYATTKVTSEAGFHYFILAPGQTKISCKYTADAITKKIDLLDKTKNNILCQTWHKKFDWKKMIELLKNLHAYDEQALQQCIAQKNPQLLMIINSLNIS